MKQLTITPEIIGWIQAVAGVDVSLEGISVFECIALNTLPLPGKQGSLFEAAVITPLTLRQMADYINANGLPLCEDHSTEGPPMGKLFHADVFTNTANGVVSAELRALFYLDPTEQERIVKLNAGVIDEVSVGFLGSQMVCSVSDCGFDYLDDASTIDNVWTRTCGNGHVIGSNGVHVTIDGLNSFFETSLVTRGAADNPKIVGKSASKISAPPSTYRLAAKGSEVNPLALQATLGESDVDLTAVLALLATKTTEHATLVATSTATDAKLTAVEASITAANLKTIAAETALEAKTVEFTTLQASNVDAAKNALEVVELRAKLAVLLPVGGAAEAAAAAALAAEKAKGERDLSQFKTKK